MNITLIWRYQQKKYTETIYACQYKPEKNEKILIESDWYDGPSHYGIVTDVRWEYGKLLADTKWSFENPPIVSVTVYLDHSETYEEIF